METGTALADFGVGIDPAEGIAAVAGLVGGIDPVVVGEGIAGIAAGGEGTVGDTPSSPWEPRYPMGWGQGDARRGELPQSFLILQRPVEPPRHSYTRTSLTQFPHTPTHQRAHESRRTRLGCCGRHGKLRRAGELNVLIIKSAQKFKSFREFKMCAVH